MKWSIPAKTFFLGEYAAIAGGPAILLTTTPCFEVSLSNEPGLKGIHADSPAGRLWAQEANLNKGLLWHDPYNGLGGMGASSAQWLGAYFAQLHLQKKEASQDDMLSRYFQCAWQGSGMRPSGYDVIAQSQMGCVYIHRQEAHCHPWPFDDLAFILVHTGQKLATHHHLQALTMPSQIEQLALIVESAKLAFDLTNSAGVITAVNAYHQCLLQMELVAAHSLDQIKLLQAHPDVLAIKGCGAMGADVLLLLVLKNKLVSFSTYLTAFGLNILATSENLHMECKKSIDNT